MVLTYKVKHNRDFTHELQLAKKVAEFAITNRDKLSTRYIKHYGLNSRISNPILQKYGRNKKCKKVRRTKLTISGWHIKFKDNNIYVPCLKLNIRFEKEVAKINQIELDNEYVFIYCTVGVNEPVKTINHIGVDLNTTGHSAVIAVKETGKVYKLGKEVEHIRSKYRTIRRNLQKQNKNKLMKKIGNRESRIVRNVNHKISRKM